jgi:hypothetical protein
MDRPNNLADMIKRTIKIDNRFHLLVSQGVIACNKGNPLLCYFLDVSLATKVEELQVL